MSDYGSGVRSKAMAVVWACILMLPARSRRLGVAVISSPMGGLVARSSVSVPQAQVPAEGLVGREERPDTTEPAVVTRNNECPAQNSSCYLCLRPRETLSQQAYRHGHPRHSWGLKDFVGRKSMLRSLRICNSELAKFMFVIVPSCHFGKDVNPFLRLKQVCYANCNSAGSSTHAGPSEAGQVASHLRTKPC